MYLLGLGRPLCIRFEGALLVILGVNWDAIPSGFDLPVTAQVDDVGLVEVFLEGVLWYWQLPVVRLQCWDVQAGLSRQVAAVAIDALYKKKHK